MNDFSDTLADAPSSVLPGMRSGADYLRQISNDGRHVYLDGELVRDVPNHPAFAGAAHALSAAAVLLALRYVVGLRGRGGMVLAVGLSWLFAFNGLALAQVRYPHFEILIVSAMMLLFVAWRLGWRRRAMAALAWAPEKPNSTFSAVAGAVLMFNVMLEGSAVMASRSASHAEAGMSAFQPKIPNS